MEQVNYDSLTNIYDVVSALGRQNSYIQSLS